MTYSLKLNDGRAIELRFSMYFLNRICKITGQGLSTIYEYLFGDWSQYDTGIVSGGFMDDVEIRAKVIAAAFEADQFAKGYSQIKDPVSKEIYDIMEAVEGGLVSDQWREIMLIIVQTLTASLPKGEGFTKKKAAPKKKSTGTRSKLSA